MLSPPPFAAAVASLSVAAEAQERSWSEGASEIADKLLATRQQRVLRLGLERGQLG